MLRLLVTGTRHGRADVDGILCAYAAVYGLPEQMIVGGLVDSEGNVYQRGVDLQAYQWAASKGVRVHVEPAIGEWPAAGPRRNTRMVGRCQRGDHCIAFPSPNPEKRKGTTGCYTLAMANGLIGWWL